MTDKFFTQPNCDRCTTTLAGQSRTMSWFTEECLCTVCSNKEKFLRQELEAEGHNCIELEGCGYIPQLKCQMKGE